MGEVARLQARARGLLVRRRLRGLRAEFERVVAEVEGSLERLRWTAGPLPRPRFLPAQPVQRPTRGEKPGALEAGPGEGHVQAAPSPLAEPPSEHRSETWRPSQLPAEASDPARESAGGPQRLSEESEEGPDCSGVSSVWSSGVLERESPGLSQDLHLRRGKVMPQTVSGLQCYRQHLTMELLWLQQAITSRKHYLLLKQRLGNPE